jgi:5-methylcytosine-specific restriction endonuclease McrA
VRRALSANPLGVVEAFTRLDVMVRDGWVCQLCAEPIDPDLKHPHPQSASLDHVIPLARGGHHMLTNCQAAHLRCNLKKWAHMPGQEASRG